MAELAILETHPIRVTADGRWLHGDSPLHPRVEALFKRSVVPTEAGDYFLQIDGQRHLLEVADTPYSVTTLSLEDDPSGALRQVRLTLSDGAREPLDAATLMAAADHTLYCRIRRHGLAVPCRIPTRHYYPLALRMEMDGDRVVLPLAGQRFEVAPYEARPTH